MEKALVKEIIKTKMELLKQTTITTLNPKESNENKLLNIVLLSWLENVENLEQLEKKYQAFNKLYDLEILNKLFKTTVYILSKNIKFSFDEKNQNFTLDVIGDNSITPAFEEKYLKKIEEAIELYKLIINDDEYKNLSSESGYVLSEDFSVEENYKNNKLANQIVFFYNFKRRIDDSYLRIHEKDGEKKYER